MPNARYTARLDTTLEPALREVVDAESAAHNVSVSQLVRACLRHVLVDHGDDDLVTELLVDDARSAKVEATAE